MAKVELKRRTMRLPELIYVIDLPVEARQSVEELADIAWLTVVWILHERMHYPSAKLYTSKIMHHLELLQEYLRAAGGDIRGWDGKKIVERLETQLWDTQAALRHSGEIGSQLMGIASFYYDVWLQVLESSNRILEEDISKLLDTADSCFEIITQLENIDIT